VPHIIYQTLYFIYKNLLVGSC